MFKKLIEMIKQALRQMVAYKDVSDAISNVQTISDEMTMAIELWRKMYKGEAPWLNADKGVYSLGIEKDVCQKLAMLVLSEAKIEIATKEDTLNPRAEFLNDILQAKLVDVLRAELEKAMAVGGFIVRPYLVGDEIGLDFCRQGEFYPIAFDGQGNIIDVAFTEQIIADGFIYTRVERQTFDASKKTVVIENKAYKAKLRDVNDNADQELGTEVNLDALDVWASIEPFYLVPDMEQPMYGYYKTPNANSIDMNSPLGVSVYDSACSMIKRADIQYSRLDWEYEGGQLAIDVDPTALGGAKYNRFGQLVRQDELTERLYRKLDLGIDGTYNAFAPALRDSNYLQGLNRYLTRVEDLVGLARGALAEVGEESKTATEIKISKQKSYCTVADNQKALEKCINGTLYAINRYVDLYNLAPQGEFELVVEWSDSVLTDIDTELQQKIALKNIGAMSSAEIRAWYTGEPLEVAEAKIAEIETKANEKLMSDVFTSKEQTLEKE